MNSELRVFLDTSVRKHAVRKRTLLRRLPGSVSYQFYDFDPTAGAPVDLKREIDLLPQVADLARAGRIKLLSHIEVTAELLGTLLMPGPGESVFHGLDVEKVSSPIEYTRIAGPWPPYVEGSAKEIQADFFDQIQDGRFLEIRRACGAYQGDGAPVRASQIMDAFHIWCAESADASHFLTTDFKLTRVVKSYKRAPLKLKVVRPSELLMDLN